MRLDGKVAIITGAGGGVGKAAAKIFTKEGARVVIAEMNEVIGKQTEEELRLAGYEAFFIKTDISNEEDVINLVDKTINLYGKIDILYNNAGLSRRPGMSSSILNTTLSDWNIMLSVNLNGTFLMTKHVLPHMIQQNSGNIVNTSSMNALIGNPNTSDAYTAAKGGVLSLTRSWAADFAKYNIRINCICPGPIDTPMLAPALVNPARGHAHYNERTLIGRIAQPEEVANVALFLSSEEASYLTGVILPVEGGWTAI
jgi:NAD(P)-dependent dehydrogenase (short-subunit alcohol dehydrogenase family)